MTNHDIEHHEYTPKATSMTPTILTTRKLSYLDLTSTYTLHAKTEECCSHVILSASGAIKENQAMALVEFDREGTRNSHPSYHASRVSPVEGQTMDFYLYFVGKGGSFMDGWTVSMEPLDDWGGMDLLVTTRSKADCPDEVKLGYHYGWTEDDTFRIKCSDGNGINT